MKCTECGNEISGNSKFCKYCGAPLKHSAEIAEKDKNVLKRSPGKEIIKDNKFRGAKFGKLWNMAILFLSGALLIIAGLNFVNVGTEYWKGRASRETLESDREDMALAAAEALEEELQVEKEVVQPKPDIESVPDIDPAPDMEPQQVNESEKISGEELPNNMDREEEADLPVEVTEPVQEDAFDLQEYILVDSDCRYISETELEGLTKEQLKIARNEIYARHGRKFEDEGLRNYFSQFAWYDPTIEPEDFQESMLNDYETANRDLIVQYEKEHGYR